MLCNTPYLHSTYPQRIILFIRANPEQYKGLNAEIHQTEPDFRQLMQSKTNDLIILDDFSSLLQNKDLQDVFEIFLHHNKKSLILVVHHYFMKHLRSLRLQVGIHVLFDNANDRTIVQTMARQLYPHKKQIFLDAYKDAMSKPYGHLVYIALPGYKYRLRTNIFNIPMIVYKDE